VRQRPAANFTNNAYEGTWFEIAKYQTAGGAFLSVTASALKSKRQHSPLRRSTTARISPAATRLRMGNISNATGRLYDEAPPGKWMQKLMAFVPPVSYDRRDGVMAGEEYSVEYDCGGSNYCVHLSARKPTMSSELLQHLLGLVEDMKLNVHNLPLRVTNQTGCW